MMTSARWFLTMTPRLAGGRVAKSAALVGLGLLPMIAGCTKQQQQGTGSSYLIVNSLEAASGAKPTEFSGALASDVVTLVKQTDADGNSVFVPTIYDDPGQVSFSLGLKDPGSADSPTSPTSANFITVNRYHVEFVRADGRNTPGVDVPYPFDGGMTVTVAGSRSQGAFTLVRIQAKEEAPLRALRGGGGAQFISTLARVTFYGTDQTGREVSVTATIGVDFGDFGDPQ